MASAWPPAEIKWATLANALELPYVRQGDESGLPVVLLHAYADSWRSFELVLPHLPRSIRAAAVTQRGHGEADKPASGYAVTDFADDLVAFLDALGVERAVLVASSSAGFTAQRFAMDNPGRTLGLVLIGVPWSLGDAAESDLAKDVFALSDPVDPAFVREFVASTVFGQLSPVFLEELVGESLKVPARVWKATLEGLLEAVPAAASGTIAAPTLIVWGDRDNFVLREDQERLTAAISNSRLVVYEGVGHAVHWEQPERVAADIEAFLEVLTRSADASFAEALRVAEYGELDDVSPEEQGDRPVGDDAQLS
jgi:non-heme chloroperoxidase